MYTKLIIRQVKVEGIVRNQCYHGRKQFDASTRTNLKTFVAIYIMKLIYNKYNNCQKSNKILHSNSNPIKNYDEICIAIKRNSS